MDEVTKIVVLDNMIEAQMLDCMLTEQRIPHVMKTYHDSAYDGLFQGSRGWGHVEAPTKHRPDITAILEDLRHRAGENTDRGSPTRHCRACTPLRSATLNGGDGQRTQT